MKPLVLAGLLFCCSILCPGQAYQFGKSYSDSEGWTSLTVGNMPLVISVPHGGMLDLDSVEDRNCADAVTVTDSYTKELAREIEAVMQKFYGLKPYIVVCNLRRKEVDQNREIENGTCGNPAMDKPWNVFHNYLDTALAMATRQFGSCLYIDLHGHGHENQRLELGYLLKATELPDALNGTEKTAAFTKKSSLNNLIETSDGKQTLQGLLTGDNAFGTMMANEGFPAVPSKQDPLPLEGEKYFNGGYNSRQYTTDKYANVYGWQIECNLKGVRDAAGRPIFARAFSKVILKYLKLNTPVNFPALQSIHL